MFNAKVCFYYAKRFWGMVVTLTLMIPICPGLGPMFPPSTQAQTFSDSGFSAEVVTTLPQFLPVGVTWANDGRMFIWQRNGVIRIYKNGQLLPTPFLDVSANVNTFDDRGMLGLALHPNFAVNGYVYVIYVREDGGNPNDSSPKTERLSRFIANAQNPDVALSNSETVLMTIPTEFHHHENGTLRFGSDGRLFVGHGEDTTAGGIDVNAFVAQEFNDPRGKILRITEDGNAPGDNPFDDGTNSIKSKVYSYGLRNPFRFTLHPVSGEPYIGDVGWNTWEEFSRGRGKNFGWPCYEGVNPQPDYQNAFPALCAPLTSGVVTVPLIAYPHPGTPGAGSAPFVGNSAIGGPFYIATVYPEAYRNTWFITDYAAGWIRRMTFDQAGNMTGTVPFADGLQGPVDMELGPDGLLYYVEINTGRVMRVRYNGPTAVAAATPSSGYSALTVNFSSAGSSGPNGTSLSYLWDFGDGQTSTVANPSHTYTSSTVQTFTARLTVTTSTNQSSAATVKVTVGSVPPNPPTIQAPSDGTGVLPGQTVVYQGSATDPDDGTIPPTGLKWTILLHHNDHTHTQLFTTGSTGSVSIQYHGIGTYSYEFQLSATDSSGLSRTTSVNLPVLSDTIKPSDPSGLVGTAISPSQVNLTWASSTDNSGSVGYQVERCQGAGCTNFVQIATVGTASYTDSSVTGGTTYNYRVRATDSSGNQSLNTTNTSVTTGGSSNLVTALGMNEGTGTTLADNSGSGHTGTLVNGPLWLASQASYGQSVSFDGVNDAVSVANPVTYNFGTADFTIEFWVKRNVLGGGQRHLFSKCGATTWAVGCKELYFSSGNQLVFGSFNTGDTFAGTIADTNWHHVAVTFADSTNTLLMYVDGVQVTTATKALEADSAGHVVTLGNMHGSNPFSGQLDELRIYNRVLTLAEIQTDRITPIAPGSSDTTPPSTVAGLNATAVSGPQINLSWTAATDNIAVTGYRVERCQGVSCTTFAQIEAPSGTTFSDTGVAASTSYSYRVKAVDGAGNVSVNYSNVATATTATDTTAPTTPTGLTATAGTNQITLTWAASTDNGGSGLAGYEVLRCQGAGCTSFALIATISTTSYTDTGLTANTSYSYRIQAVDGALNRSSAASISATTGGGGGGTGLVTALGMNEGSGIVLADASGAGHTGTLVNGPLWVAGQATYGQSVSFDGVNDAVSVANPNTYNFGTADFTIELWVKRNTLGGGQRHLVSKCDATTWAIGCKELYFNANNQLAFGSFSTSDAVAGTIGDTNWHHVAVTFTDSTNTLRMYVDGALITTATRALEADGAGHVVTLGNMHGSNPFSGQLDELRIYNRVLTLAEIQTDRITPIAPGSSDTTPPSTVAGLNATAVSGPQINLSWTAATDNIAVTGYRVERCQGVSCTTFAQIATPSGTTFNDTGLAASTSYSYRVKAADAAGNVSVNYSNVATTTTSADTTAPTTPTGLAATAGTNQITLTWAASTDNGGSGLAGYEVLRCQGAGCTSFALIATISTTSYTDTGLTANTSYSYRIQAVDGALNRSSAASISTTTGGGGGGTSLVTALGMNEGSGTTLADASGVGHTGTLVNGPLWVASQTTYGQSVSFDGVNDAVSVANPNTYNFGTADFTIELWVKRNALGGGQRHLLSKCDATNWVVGCKELYFRPNNQLAFGSYSTSDTLAGTIGDTNWHHVAVTFADSTNTLRMYVDGVLITTATRALEADGAGHVVTLGNMHNSNPFSGQLDELRIYNRVLTLAEIQTDRATPIAPGSTDTTPPSTVAGLNATAVSGPQINLSWTAATDNIAVTGYRVERCQGVSCATFAQIATPSGTTFNDTGLAASTSYSYRVKAADAAGNVSVNYSNVATTTTSADTTAPTTPTGLAATAGTNQITLTWAASTDTGGSGLTGYEVLRCQGAGCTIFTLIATVSTTSYTDTGLTASTSYTYQVRALDGALNRSSAATISATTGSGGSGGTGLVTAMGMNEGSGTTVGDGSGNNHTGTLVNGPLWVAGQATYGQSVSFDGVNDAVSVANPNTYNFGTADFTIELWVKRNALGGGQRHLLSKCDTTSWAVGCKELYFNNSNQLVFGSFSTGDVFASTIADTNWHHVAVTFADSTNTLRMYVDGVLITGITQALEADGASHVVTLGNLHGSNPFSGQLDELRIYDRALSLSEIQADRSTPIAP